MNTESRQQIAREAALELYGTSHGTGQLDRPIAIILSAIERATEAKDKEIADHVVGMLERQAAQPQRSRTTVGRSGGQNKYAGGKQPQRSEQQFIPPPTGAQLAWQETVSEQQEWTPEYVEKMFEANFKVDTVSAIVLAHTAALTAEREKRDRITIDDGSLGGMKIEWHDEDGRHYVYDKDGKFLWSGEPTYNVWKCARLSEQLTAERQHYDLNLAVWEKDNTDLRNQLTTERQLRDEARAQREWLIKECARIGVTVNVRIGAPITEAYLLVNTELTTERQRRDKEIEAHEIEVSLLHQSRNDIEQRLLAALDALVELLDTSTDPAVGVFPTAAHLQARIHSVHLLKLCKTNHR